MLTCSVASFVPKHAEWDTVKRQRGSTFAAYQELMNRTPEIVSRSQAIEEQLREREERAAKDATGVSPPPTAAPDAAPDAGAGELPKGGTSLSASAPVTRSNSGDAQPAPDVAAPDADGGAADSEADLASRLAALRTRAGSALDGAPRRPTSVASPPEQRNLSLVSEAAAAYPPIEQLEAERSGSSHGVDGADGRASSEAPRPPPPRRALPTVPRRGSAASSESGTQPGTTPAAAKPPAPPPTTAAPPLPTGSCVTVEELWKYMYPGFERTHDADGREWLAKRPGRSVLLLDVRARSRIDEGWVRGADHVGIDPSIVHPGMDADALIDALRETTPEEELERFVSRGEYELLVLYDQRSRTFPSEPTALTAVRDIVQWDASHPPVLLRGGFDSWSRAVGDAGVEARVKRPPGPAPAASPPAPATAPAQPVPAAASAAPSADAALDSLRRSRGDVYRRTGAGRPTSIATESPFASSGAGVMAGSPKSPPSALAMPPRSYQNGTRADIPMALHPGPPSRSLDYPVVPGARVQAPPPAAAPSGSGRVPSSLLPAPQAAQQHPTPSAMRNTVLDPRDVRVGLSGLKNFGNSCYMNATLQCLNATVPLARFMLDGSYRRAINLQNPLGTRGVLAEAFAQLLRTLWSEQYRFVSPMAFREAIARFAPAFRSSEQQDSQEFLTFLLDGLHEDLNLVVHRPPPMELGEAQQAEFERLPQQLASVAEWSMYRKRNDSVIVDTFQGQLRNRLTCITCGHTSTTYNAFMSLSLPIPTHGRSRSPVPLVQCLDAFVKEEVLEKADAWHCPKCKKPRRATKQLSFSRLPPVLLLHLKRFTFRGPFTDKIDTQVTFPESGLDLSNYMPPPLPPGTSVHGITPSRSQRPPYIYDLYGVTHHFGTLNAGHYTASIRTGDKWFYCDDSHISPGNEGQIRSNSPYVLFFGRRTS